MPRVAVRQLARFQIESAGEGRDEKHLRVIPGDLVVGDPHQCADRSLAAFQRGALVECLADRHEQAGRQALARHVPDQEKQPVVAQQEEVVKVTAHLSRGSHGRRELDAALVLQELGARKKSDLDALGGLELAGDVRRLLTLRLHDLLQPLLLPACLPERQHEQHAE